MRRRKARFGLVGIVARGIAGVCMGLLFLLSIPVVLPFVAIAEKRIARRKHDLVEEWPCGWCVAPLGHEALTRADAVFAAYAEDAWSARHFVTARIVRDLHACCPRCDAGHRYDERAGRFALLHREEFRHMFGEALRKAVPPATVALTWPWLAPPAAMHRLALTRDGAWPANDGVAPHDGELEVPVALDVAAIAEALLRSPWLAPAGRDAGWWCAAGPVALVFGRRGGHPFLHRIGADAVATNIVAEVRVHHAAQQDPSELCREVAKQRAGASAQAGTAPPRDD